MKKLKVFLCVALFGAMSFGVFSAYEHYTMSDAERALLENVEALTSNESSGKCYQTMSRCGGTGINFTCNKVVTGHSCSHYLKGCRFCD